MNELIEFLKDMRLVIGCLTSTIVVDVIDSVFGLNEPGLSTMCYIMSYLLCLNLFCLRAYITFLKEDIKEAVERANICRDRFDELFRTYDQESYAFRNNLIAISNENAFLRTQLNFERGISQLQQQAIPKRRILEL